MKIILAILAMLLLSLLLSGCGQSEREREGQQVKVLALDCIHNVVCYEGLYNGGQMSCTVVVNIPECQQMREAGVNG